jgi:hypothetical protein
MKKETTFSQYVAKEKLKGNYTYDVQLDEGLGDIFKKSWHNTKKHLSGNLKADKIELWRLNFDFTNRSFRQGLIEKCTMVVVKDSKSGNDVDGLQETILNAITETINGTIDKLVGLARGTNTKYDNPSDNPGNDEDELLYDDPIEGYKYSWVQDGHLFMYYDSKEHVEDFLNERLSEQKILEVAEDVIKGMVKIEKCTRRKDKTYEKVENEKRSWKSNKTLAKAKFTNDNSKVIYDKIKDEIEAAVKENRFGKEKTCGRVVWEITDKDIEELLSGITGGDSEVISDEITKKINDQFKKVKDLADNFNFLYGRGSQKGNIFLNFESLTSAKAFREEAEGQFIGSFKEPTQVKINSKSIELNKSK